MVREKSRAKKRKFHGNRFDKIVKKRRTNKTIESCVSEDNAGGQSTSNATVSASSRKIGVRESPINATKEMPDITGYRFIDMEILTEVFQQVACKECGESSSFVFEDKSFERKGSASHLRLRCKECGWVFTFYSSKKINKSFEVNKRFVYAMRSIGKGHASMKRFCTYMNMPPPMHFEPYRKCNTALSKAAKSVAMRAMNDAAIEVRGENPDPLTRCGVSCDGTWQRRGYSSLHGCVTTLSIDAGKCLDVEVLTKVCHGCQRIARENDASKKADIVEKHSCKMNYKGSSPAMETEGIKRIFARSETTRQAATTVYRVFW